MWDWISKLDELRKQSQPFAIATVSRSTGSSPREIGAKMIVLADGSFFGTIGGGYVEKAFLDDLKNVFSSGTSQTRSYPLDSSTGQVCGGTMEVLIEVMNTGPRLYLFGAGHVGKAVCQVLEGTPFSVHLIDDREEWVQSTDIPSGVIRHNCQFETFIREAAWDARVTYCAVMTRQHDIDQDIVSLVVKHPARYVGMIGSRSKWATFQERLRKKGLSESEISRIKCPIGLDTGGKAPKEVAISVAAELLSILYEKSVR